MSYKDFIIGGNDFGLIGAGLGCLMGLVFVVDGWRGDLSNEKFQNRFRVKSLLYALGSIVTPLLADWKLFGVGDSNNELRVVLFENYFAYFILSIAAFLAAFAVLMLANRLTFSRTANVTPIMYMLNFLHYGYGYCQTIDAAEIKAREEYSKASRKPLYAELAVSLTAILISTDKFLAIPSQTRQPNNLEYHLKQCLKHLETAVRIVLELEPDVRVNINLMRKVPFAVTAVNKDDLTRFDATSSGKYEWILNPEVAIGELDNWQPIFLPVPIAKGYAKLVFPGAPKALLAGRPEVCDLKSLQLSDKIPKAVRDYLKTYFEEKRKHVGHLISLPISAADGEAYVGVVNVEIEDLKRPLQNDGNLAYFVKQSTPYMILLQRLMS